jgi:hypothetical protein
METTVLKELQQIRLDLLTGDISTSGELARRLSNVIEDADINLTLPRIAPSEPPSSVKYNRTANMIEKALANREYVFDILLAASTYDFDTALSMLNSLEDKILGLVDSVKTLYFYTQPARSNVHIISTDFKMGWGVFQKNTATLDRRIGVGLSLPITKKESVVGKGYINGNGIAGNFYLLDSNGNLVGEGNDNSDLNHIGDCNPSTHFEYERFRITPAVLADTKGYGFGFSNFETKWAAPTYNNVELDIIFDLRTPTECNYIVVSPGVASDEFIVKSIALSSGGVERATLEPKNLVINQALLMHGEDGYTNEGAYVFESCSIDKAVIKLEATKPVPCRVRHYYVVDANGVRVAGESPPLSEPHLYVAAQDSNDELHKTEDLAAERFSIGLKDIFLQKVTYGVEGFVTTEPIRFNQPIDRIALRADYSIPVDSVIQFNVSVDNGETWYGVSPLGESIKNQILAINDMVPDAYQDPSTRYISASGNPKEFLFRIACKREKGESKSTPIIRSLELEVTLKQ